MESIRIVKSDAFIGKVGKHNCMDSEVSINRIFTAYINIKQSPYYLPVVKAVSLLKAIILQGRTQNLYVSFNGGKDATIALFLLVLAFKELQLPFNIQCIYFEQPHPFEQMQQFIQKIKTMLNLQIHKMKTKAYPIQLTNFAKKHNLQWVVMGSRRDDPYCGHLSEISNSDVIKGYPAFKRVNPIIDWSCSFVWKVIGELGIPYCRLYDEGYTSLGNKKNTTKNVALLDGTTNQYRAAYHANDQDERINRQVGYSQ